MTTQRTEPVQVGGSGMAEPPAGAPAVYTPVDAAANLRRSTVIAVVVGIVAIVLTALQGHPWMGVFGLLGLMLGAVNNRMLQRSVLAYATVEGMTKARFRNGMLGRLAGITILAVVLALVVRPDGLGVFAGLAVFQVLMLVGSAVPVFRSVRPKPGQR